MNWLRDTEFRGKVSISTGSKVSIEAGATQCHMAHLTKKLALISQREHRPNSEAR